MNLLVKDKIPIWFMHPSLLSEADNVYIWAKNSTQENSMGGTEKVHFLVRQMRRFKQSCLSEHLQEGRESIVKVNRTAKDKPYIIFEATRYIYNENCEQFQIPKASIAGKCFADFHAESQLGLSKETVQQKQDIFGLNKIPFERRSISRIFRDEVLTFFYLYQFVMYLVWLWFRYTDHFLL